MIDQNRLHTILANPGQLNADDLELIGDVIKKYPYFQAARSVYLKGLYNIQSPQYNKELQITAAHTADRSVLFDFITSEVFIQNRISEQIKQQQEQLENIEVDAEEVVVRTTDLNADKNFDQVTDQDLFEKKKESQPKVLDFTQNEKHSFQEWLKLTTINPIDRSTEDQKEHTASGDVPEDEERQEKMRRIDEFLASKPKITPRKTGPIDTPAIEPIDSGSHLMTETLAKVYLAQKNYDKAIKSYQVLKLQHPEKSGFFADRIREIENLQSNS
ncbi:hypothetical protein [Nonlabens marinus]|uniref:Tetratricopeptide repeat protein n=1 Tax=Nonlabens marinus S1-08 TaxID=1454201 RepID=W8VR10_9FLAO|nr:hypothetical protein [Nonlabens marinus]BAO55375.1 hypothetical protein NMS_1366 [Nonlabens marinus S1-08]